LLFIISGDITVNKQNKVKYLIILLTIDLDKFYIIFL